MNVLFNLIRTLLKLGDRSLFSPLAADIVPKNCEARSN